MLVVRVHKLGLESSQAIDLLTQQMAEAATVSPKSSIRPDTEWVVISKCV